MQVIVVRFGPSNHTFSASSPAPRFFLFLLSLSVSFLPRRRGWWVYTKEQTILRMCVCVSEWEKHSNVKTADKRGGKKRGKKGFQASKKSWPQGTKLQQRRFGLRPPPSGGPTATIVRNLFIVSRTWVSCLGSLTFMSTDPHVALPSLDEASKGIGREMPKIGPRRRKKKGHHIYSCPRCSNLHIVSVPF